MSGFLPLSRDFFLTPEWREEGRDHSRAEALLDLLQLAAFAHSEKIIKGELVTLQPGELCASTRYLSARWNWSVKKVRSFLDGMESRGFVKRRVTQQGTHLTVLRLITYAEPGHAFGRSNGQNEGTPGAQIEQGRTPKQRKKKECPISWSTLDGYSGIPEADIADWQKAYPLVNFETELAKMHVWQKRNPVKTDFPRFIDGWLSRSQERATTQASSPQTKPGHTNGYQEDIDFD